MKKTYQPFIIEKSKEILDILKEDVKNSEFTRDRLCDLLTDKFINGELDSEDPINSIFNEEEILLFINEAAVYDDISHLIELGLVNSFDEDSFFLTEKGKKCVEEIMKKK